MATRLELQSMLETILGSRNVYFQPPENIKMNFPAIVYSRENIRNTFADNSVYAQANSYSLIVIDSDPDSETVSRISVLPMCRFSRSYKSDNLNHSVFTLNF